MYVASSLHDMNRPLEVFSGKLDGDRRKVWAAIMDQYKNGNPFYEFHYPAFNTTDIINLNNVVHINLEEREIAENDKS